MKCACALEREVRGMGGRGVNGLTCKGSPPSSSWHQLPPNNIMAFLRRPTSTLKDTCCVCVCACVMRIYLDAISYKVTEWVKPDDDCYNKEKQ